MAHSGLFEGARHMSALERKLEAFYAASSQSLPFAILDRLVDLGLDGIVVEARGCRHRWEFDGRLRKLCHLLLHPHKAPSSLIVQRLTASRRRPLERILTDVDGRWHVRVHLLSRPTIGLLKKNVLEIVEPDSAELRSAEVEDFMPHRWSLALKQVHLVVAVEMVFVGPVAELHPF